MDSILDLSRCLSSMMGRAVNAESMAGDQLVGHELGAAIGTLGAGEMAVAVVSKLGRKKVFGRNGVIRCLAASADA